MFWLYDRDKVDMQATVDLTKDVPEEGVYDMTVTDIEEHFEEQLLDRTAQEAVQLLEVSRGWLESNEDSDDDDQATKAVTQRLHKDTFRCLL